MVRSHVSLTIDNEVWDRFYKILMHRTNHNGSASAAIEAYMRSVIKNWDDEHLPKLIFCACGAKHSERLEECPKCHKKVGQ